MLSGDEPADEACQNIFCGAAQSTDASAGDCGIVRLADGKWACLEVSDASRSSDDGRAGTHAAISHLALGCRCTSSTFAAVPAQRHAAALASWLLFTYRFEHALPALLLYQSSHDLVSPRALHQLRQHSRWRTRRPRACANFCRSPGGHATLQADRYPACLARLAQEAHSQHQSVKHCVQLQPYARVTS